MADDGRAAAQTVIDGLDEPRRSQMQHLHEVILDALPGIDVGVWDYSGKLIGYGSYDYTNSKGPAGRWFSVGLANRKNFISLYAMASSKDGYYVESVRDRFPGMNIGRSCINITKPEQVDDDAVRDLARVSWAQYRDGFRRSDLPTRKAT
jgi:Domain of unknown function (DU1801)